MVDSSNNNRVSTRGCCSCPTVGQVVKALDEVFPLHSQDSWDNSGLLVGDQSSEVKGILLTVDITEAAVAEAINKECNVIVSHHPLMFRGLKRLTGGNAEQRIVMTAIREGIALIAFHTPADKSIKGTSGSIGKRLGLTNMSILALDDMHYNKLFKVATFVPMNQAEQVRSAMAEAGAGHIGDYSHCTWETAGDGRFMAHDGATPFVGNIGELHVEKEVRIEAVVRGAHLDNVLRAIRKAHPYEVPAIDSFPMEEIGDESGYGVVGELPNEIDEKEFLELLKRQTGCQVVRHNGNGDRHIKHVAICTGSGSEFVSNAARSKADAYVTADMKYHQLMDASESLLVADIGHFETEEITIDVFGEVLTKKIPNFARYFRFGINPIKYY